MDNNYEAKSDGNSLCNFVVDFICEGMEQASQVNVLFTMLMPDAPAAGDVYEFIFRLNMESDRLVAFLMAGRCCRLAAVDLPFDKSV